LSYAPGALREKFYGPGADHPAARFRGVAD
jgi:hypothetical protein